MVKLAIIVPMYNEEMNAEKCVKAISSEILPQSPSWHLFIVNDGSKDRTAPILDSLLSENQYPMTVVTQNPNQGYGSALIAGAKAAAQAGYEYGLFMDSDLTNDPKLISVFANKLQEGNYDLIKASRYIKGGGMRGVPYYRQMFTIVGNWVASRLFRIGIKDCTNGFRAVRLSLIVDFKFKETGFPLLLEELYLLKKKKIRSTEIPYILTAREEEQGASKFYYSPGLLWRYFKYALFASCMKSK